MIKTFPIFILVFGFALVGTTAQGKPLRENCNPDGAENERIACVHNDNVERWERLVQHYQRRLDKIWDDCRAENPGGGSGGHLDRVDCVRGKLDNEERRVNLPSR